MILKRLDSGFWYIAGVGACNYAQPPHWPCDEATLRAHMHPDAGLEFVRDAMAYSDAASLRARVAAAVAECEGILRHTVTLAVDDAHTRGYVAGMAQAARDIRAKLEGR